MSESSFEPVPEAIADRYGVVIPASWERLLSDTTGGVFRAGEFVVRVEPADPESVRWEHALLRFLANEVEQVVAPLEALDGSTFYVDGSRVVSVFPFVEGENYGLTRRSSDKSCRRCSHVCIDTLRRGR